jgi:hypothetical protein
MIFTFTAKNTLKVYYQAILRKPALAIRSTSIFLVTVRGIPIHRRLPCSAAFLPRFAMLHGTHLSAKFSKKKILNPAPAVLHGESLRSRRSIFFMCDFTSVKPIRVELFRT